MGYAHPEYLVETGELEARLGDPALRVIDCTLYLPNYFDESAGRRIEMVSGRENYAAGHIPGGAFVDLRADLCDRENRRRFMYPMPPAGQFEEVMSRLGVGEGTRVVLYDDMFNMWATRVWWMLRHFGFDGAAVLSGGWKKWKQEGRPVSTAPCAYPAARFSARPRPGRIADRDEVLASIGRDDRCLVNALDPEEYAGRGPNRYGRTGHIPSSVNVPFLDVVDPGTHAYLPAEALRARFERTGTLEAKRVITYCGGGIAATSVAFALGLLGVDDVALYDGSMTEWAADPTLPIVSGDRP
jgi:thiosulfate/3-mercaptopyruvate sulfurtransferase